MITLRALASGELAKIRGIDRTERIRTRFFLDNGRLVARQGNWDAGPWREGEGPHTYGNLVHGGEELLEQGGKAFGAFDGRRLVGIAIYRPKLRPTMGQLALLHVSCGCRRRGISSQLLNEVVRCALEDGATHLYVSATPSPSALGFYLRQGFAPTDDPDPELLAEEPSDIHMVMPLPSPGSPDRSTGMEGVGLRKEGTK